MDLPPLIGSRKSWPVSVIAKQVICQGARWPGWRWKYYHSRPSVQFATTRYQNQSDPILRYLQWNILQRLKSFSNMMCYATKTTMKPLQRVMSCWVLHPILNFYVCLLVVITAMWLAKELGVWRFCWSEISKLDTLKIITVKQSSSQLSYMYVIR